MYSPDWRLQVKDEKEKQLSMQPEASDGYWVVGKSAVKKPVCEEARLS